MKRTSLIGFLIAMVLIPTAFTRSHGAQSPGTTSAKAETDPFAALRQDLDKKRDAQQISSDQYNRELSRLNQLKTQQQLDLQQGGGSLTKSQKDMYNDLLGQIHNTVEKAAPVTIPGSTAGTAAGSIQNSPAVISTSVPSGATASTGTIPSTASPVVSSGIPARP